MPPGSAQPDLLFNSFCNSCQFSRCRSSCVFATSITVSAPAPPRRRVTHALPEPSMLAPVVCDNSFSAFKEEPLYNFPLDVGLNNPAPRCVRRFCISAIGIESPKAANLQLTCQSFEPEPVLESKPDDIISKAPEHEGATFIKNIKNNKSPWPAVAKIMTGLGSPCEDDDFHCPMDCDTPENHIENQSMKLEPDNSWLSNAEPIVRVRYSTALPHLLLFIIFLISHVYYICYFLLSMYGHQSNAGTLSHVISINYQKWQFPFISNHVQEPNLI